MTYDRSAAAVIRELRYPSRKALKQWVSEYEATGTLHGGYRVRRPKYSDEQKRAAGSLSREEWIRQEQDSRLFFTPLLFEITGRQITGSGDPATVTGVYRYEYEGKFTGQKYRVTANFKATLGKQGGAWIITGLELTNLTEVPI